jgi:hypothetical protein
MKATAQGSDANFRVMQNRENLMGLANAAGTSGMPLTQLHFQGKQAELAIAKNRIQAEWFAAELEYWQKMHQKNMQQQKRLLDMMA